MFPLSLFVPSQTTVTEHQVVVGLNVFGVHVQSSLERRNRIGVAALEKEDAAQLIQRHTIARVLRSAGNQTLVSAVVVARGLLNL